jgi:hypothetical protein
MDSTGNCRLPSMSPSTGLGRIKHLDTKNGKILNLKTWLAQVKLEEYLV